MNLEQNNIEINEETQNFLPSNKTNIIISNSNENEYVIIFIYKY